jgi:hypothetical protein
MNHYQTGQGRCPATHPDHGWMRCARVATHRGYDEEHRAIPSGISGKIVRWREQQELCLADPTDTTKEAR